jgi:hypothetical protein
MMTLKTKFKFIEFIAYKDNAWACINKRFKDTLGGVSYYPTWKEFIFEPNPGAVFSASCLNDIHDFLCAVNQGER